MLIVILFQFSNPPNRVETLLREAGKTRDLEQRVTQAENGLGPK